MNYPSILSHKVLYEKPWNPEDIQNIKHASEDFKPGIPFIKNARPLELISSGWYFCFVFWRKKGSFLDKKVSSFG